MMSYSKAYNNCVIDFTLNTLDMAKFKVTFDIFIY